MKRSVILTNGEVETLISELEVAIDTTEDTNQSMYLSNILNKLKNSRTYKSA